MVEFGDGLHSEWSDLDKSPLWTVSLSSYGVCSRPARDFFPSLKLTNKNAPKKIGPWPQKGRDGGNPNSQGNSSCEKFLPQTEIA